VNARAVLDRAPRECLRNLVATRSEIANQRSPNHTEYYEGGKKGRANHETNPEPKQGPVEGKVILLIRNREHVAQLRRLVCGGALYGARQRIQQKGGFRTRRSAATQGGPVRSRTHL
jgi:hypothetical protein